jgi:dipeptidase E
MKNMLLLSNSRMPTTGYLEHALGELQATIGTARRLVLIPFACVSKSYDAMTAQVCEALRSLHVDIIGLHTCENPIRALREAEGILVNGGNTYHLLYQLRHRELIVPLRQQILAGIPYAGWSAGSAICAPSIRTSNDMPIIDPAGLDALGVIDFQLNAHYTNAVPADWMGETRDQRLEEFLCLHPQMPILGLPEGDWLRVRGDTIDIGGPFPAKWFRANTAPKQLPAGPLPYKELTL